MNQTVCEYCGHAYPEGAGHSRAECDQALLANIAAADRASHAEPEAEAVDDERIAANRAFLEGFLASPKGRALPPAERLSLARCAGIELEA